MDATDDWRTTLQPDSRQTIVNNIMETLKSDLKSSAQLSRIVTTFEETMYMASTSKSDYLRKVSTIQSNSAGSTENPPDLVSIDSMAQTGHNAVDWQEETYQKIKSMKELYLSDLNAMYQKISIKYQQHHSGLNVQNSDQIEKLKLFKNMLERTIQFLNVSKNQIVPAVKEKLSAYEKQIISILNTNRPRKPVSAQQQIQQPGGHSLSMQQEQQQQQQQQPDNQMNHQMQPTNMQNSVSSKESTAVTSTHDGAMPLISNHMEFSSAQTIRSICNSNMFKLQYLEHQKQQLEQQFQECQMSQQWINQQMQHVLQQQQRQILQEQQLEQQFQECQMYQQWINQQMQHVLQQQRQILQEQQQQIPQLQQQFQQLASNNNNVFNCRQQTKCHSFVDY